MRWCARWGARTRWQKQHARGKMTARERLAAFFDDGVYFEIGAHGTQMGLAAGPDGTDKPPADARRRGVRQGRRADGLRRRVRLHGQGGLASATRARRRSRACAHGPPRALADGVVHRLGRGAHRPGVVSHPDMLSLFAGTGHLFREQVMHERRRAAGRRDGRAGRRGHGVHPGARRLRADGEGDRVAWRSRGRALVKAVTGQDIGEQELGGSKVHSRDERRRRRRVRGRRGVHRGREEVPLVLPVALRRGPAGPACRPTRSTAATKRCSTSCPSRTRKPYDMYKLIRCRRRPRRRSSTSSPASRAASSRASRASAGRSVGVVANQPNYLGGILDNDSADKAARFIQVCDAFNVPLVFLQDVPGFMVGSKVEHAGIIRHGAKMLHVMSAATVPKLTVVVRKAYGAGYYVMCGRAYEPDLIVSWPTGGDQRHGRRGDGRRSPRKKLFGEQRAAARGEEGRSSTRSRGTSTSTRSRAGAWSTT